MVKIFYKILLLTSLLIIEGCNVNNPKWYPIISGAETFPIEVVYGTLYLADGKKVGIPSGVIENAGWGQSSTLNNVSSDFDHTRIVSIA